MTQIVLYLILGLVTGAFSGLIGIGGGLLLIPALVFLFGMEQHQAQGTTLALMIPPIGLLAAMTYWKAGYVDIKAAALICAGFFLGGFFGAKLAILLPAKILEKIFGGVMLAMSLKMIFASK